MPAMQSPSLRAELSHAISAIQSDWSPRERARRQRLADLRQRRLVRMLSPQREVEAYDCRCDLANDFEASDHRRDDRRARCFVLIED